MTESRTPTPVDAVAERHLDDLVVLNPIEATYLGIAGQDDRLPDFSPEWLAECSAERRRALAALEAVPPVDDTDGVTVAALRDALTLGEELHAAGEDERHLDVIASPAQSIRDVFDLMATDTNDDWAVIARRMRAVPAAVEGYVASLRQAADRGHVAARRQVSAVMEQCGDIVGADGFWAKLAKDAPDALQDDLDAAARAASGAYERLAEVLRDELLPRAADVDAVGRERYGLHSRQFLGAVI